MAGRQSTPTPGASSLLPAQDATGPTLALFDLDRTLLPGSSLLALGRALVDEGVVGRRTLARAALRDARYRRRGASDADAERVRGRALEAVTGLERSSFVDLVSRVGGRLAQTVAPGARMLLDRHLAAGDFCVVLSASPHELVEAVCTVLGAHRAIGTRAAVADGRFTGELDGPFCYGAGKLTRLRGALGPVDLQDAWAYADSRSDLPLLSACGHPVAVNPDRALRNVAIANGWPVINVA
jgi:HAD superfamily hydrolase (TIGR01490 family)